MNIDQHTSLNAVIGDPLDHSLSPALHNAVYQELGIPSVMLAFAHPDIEALVAAMRTLNVQMAAVTMPHKETILEHLDAIDDVAQKIGAVNTVINNEGQLFGYNTDVTGLEKTLEGIQIRNKNVLLIGAGGVARPVAYFINTQGGKLFCLNRTREKAEALTQQFGGEAITEEKLKNQNFDIIINSTPIGMRPYLNETPVDVSLLTPDQVVLDIIYHPLETKLLREAEKIGATTISGLEMFIAQALEQIRLWSDKTPDSDKMKRWIGNYIESHPL